MTSLPSTHRRTSLLLLLSVVVTAVAIGSPILSGAHSTGTLVAERQHFDTSTSPSVAPGPTRAETAASSALRAWDRARSDAWARGDPQTLRGLYVTGALAGRADVDEMRAWTARGLRVVGLTTQLLEVEVLDQHEGAGGWTMRVRDRVVGGRVVGGDRSWPLRAGASATRVITLQRTGPAWRVARVEQVSGPGRPSGWR